MTSTEGNTPGSPYLSLTVTEMFSLCKIMNNFGEICGFYISKKRGEGPWERRANDLIFS